MIRHLAQMKWNEGVTSEQMQELTAALDALAANPVIRSLSYGTERSDRPDHTDFGVVIDFEDQARFEQYHELPERTTLLTVLRPMAATLLAIDIDLTV